MGVQKFSIVVEIVYVFCNDFPIKFKLWSDIGLRCLQPLWLPAKYTLLKHMYLLMQMKFTI